MSFTRYLTSVKSSITGQSVIGDLTDIRYLVKDILSSDQSVIGDLRDFRYLVKDILSSGQSVIDDLTDFVYH
jgi:4-alpha-glucanotransferase